MRKLALFFAVLVALVAAPSAVAAPPASIFGGDLTCAQVTADGNVAGATGQTWCGSITAGDDITSTVSTPLPSVRSTTKSFDGTPLDVNFALPGTGSAPYPVVGMFHGYGGHKMSFEDMQHWLSRGYAVYSITQRGFGESCKSDGSQAADPTGCEDGYVHLIDPRFEVRDTQLFLGQLVDQGLIKPDKIASTGGSYGGGMSMALAALKDRMMKPDGTLEPWKSPLGTAMSLAVATPTVPWTELTYALAPNGSNIDYIRDAGYYGRTGVMKESYIQGLSLQGRNAPINTDPSADILGWKALLDAGENYDDNPAITDMKTEINAYHSSYGIDHSESPAPLLISSGFTDDLFPVSEATRFYNRTRAQYPDAPLALFFGSFGHPRGQSQSNVATARQDLEDDWIDYYLKGAGTQPASDVTTYTQTCPNGTPGGGPYNAADWASIAPGEIRMQDDGGPQTVAPDGGDNAVATAWNPIFSNACATAPGTEETGTADYELPAAPAGGYTVMGAATVVADFTLSGANSQIAARLVDVSPDGTTKTLIERGLWRPENSGTQVFQLFANGWKVEEGHVLRIELLPKDAGTPAGTPLSNYGRPSNGQQAATVDDVDIRIPVVEAPGSLGGLVTAPAPKVLPDRPGVEAAAGYGATRALGGPFTVGARAEVSGKSLTAKLNCDDATFYACDIAGVKFKGAPEKGNVGRGVLIAIGRGISGRADGSDQDVTLPLTGKARNLFKRKKVVTHRHGHRHVHYVKGLKKLRAEAFIAGESAGFVTIKRTGKVK